MSENHHNSPVSVRIITTRRHSVRTVTTHSPVGAVGGRRNKTARACCGIWGQGVGMRPVFDTRRGRNRAEGTSGGKPAIHQQLVTARRRWWRSLVQTDRSILCFTDKRPLTETDRTGAAWFTNNDRSAACRGRLA